MGIEDELKKLQDSMAAFEDFSDEFDAGFSFEMPSLEPDGFQAPMGFLGYGEKIILEESLQIRAMKHLKFGPMGGGPVMAQPAEESKIIYVLTGSLSLTTESGEELLEAGTVKRIEKGCAYSIWNTEEFDAMAIELIIESA